MTALLQKQYIAVSCKGELVLLKLGDFSVSIEFPLALTISAALRFHARIAKLNSGKDGRGIHMLGVLHDASAPKRRRKRFEQRLPELLRPRGIDVRAEGQLVVLEIGRLEARFPYDVARELAQWLRVRGKEAKNNAGERAHWTAIDGIAAAIAGERSW